MARIGLIVPEYNEKSRSNLEARLNFFNDLSARTAESMHVVVVDDASTDGSTEALKHYVATNDPKFKPLFMEENGQKVGAIKKAVESLPEDVEYVVLSDFDSSITEQGLEGIVKVIEELDSDSSLAGYALKVVPDDSPGLLNEFQRVDYAMGRGFHKFIAKEKKTRCIAGAGGVWRRAVLEKIFPQHSGRHNGDDMELTALAMKQGYGIKYASGVIIKTVTPKDYFTLVKQRVRWEKGALETFSKEIGFYAKEVAKAPLLKRFGIATAFEWANWAMLPLGAYFVNGAIENRDAMYLARFYLFDLAFTGGMMLYVRNEIDDKKKALAMWPLMPLLRSAVQLPAKIRAGSSFVGDVVNDALLKAYITQPNIPGGISSAVKKAVAAAANSLYSLM